MGPLDLERAVSHFKKSREYKCDKLGNCNVAIGKVRPAIDCLYLCLLESGGLGRSGKCLYRTAVS